MTARQPAFWRVVRDGLDDVREYLSTDGGWTIHVDYSHQFRELKRAAEMASGRFDGRPVPVYVTIRKVARGHDFAWALRQMKAGKSVQRASIPVFHGLSWSTLQRVDSVGRDAFLATDWVLAEAAK